MNTFWISFVVNEAIGVAQAYIATAVANKRPALATALEAMVTAGQGVIAAIQAGN